MPSPSFSWDGVSVDKPDDDSLVIFLRDGFPMNILNPIKAVPVLVAVTGRGRGIVGVIDGEPPLGVETDDDVTARRDLLRAIGYKL